MSHSVASDRLLDSLREIARQALGPDAPDDPVEFKVRLWHEGTWARSRCPGEVGSSRILWGIDPDPNAGDDPRLSIRRHGERVRACRRAWARRGCPVVLAHTALDRLASPGNLIRTVGTRTHSCPADRAKHARFHRSNPPLQPARAAVYARPACTTRDKSGPIVHGSPRTARRRRRRPLVPPPDETPSPRTTSASVTGTVSASRRTTENLSGGSGDPPTRGILMGRPAPCSSCNGWPDCRLFADSAEPDRECTTLANTEHIGGTNGTALPL